MSNHDQTHRLRHILYSIVNMIDDSKNPGWYSKVIGSIDALDATEPPDGLMAANQEYLLRRYQCHPDPKPRPAFIGDEVACTDEDTGKVIGVMNEKVVVNFDDLYLEPVTLKHLTHPDGSPVSRIIEHRRPIPVSERRPTKEDADENGEVLVFWTSGNVSSVSWSNIGGFGYVTAWLPCPESGVECDEL